MADTTTDKPTDAPSDADSVDVDESPVPPVPEGVAMTLNGVDIRGRKGELVIDAAERNGVYIPRFCYHPRLASVGMCRMCIVEIDTGRGPALQPSCMLECSENMKIDTNSEVTEKAQDGVLEFLLINHPLDCPVCDKGGECPLQDQTMAYGPGESRFVEEKRHKEKPIPLSELVYLDRERCILCDRCTRFASDVAGDPLIQFLNRGGDMEVNTFPDQPFASYFSGNTVQICPVGALTAEPYRFKARPWDLDQRESTCMSCSVGCRVAVQSSRNEVLRYLGVDVDPVNWGWLCDKGRFDFQAVGSTGRLHEPLIRNGEDGELVPTRWHDALRLTADALRATLDAKGPEAIAVLGGARLTNEDAYAWAKLAKGTLGTDNVDCQLADGLPAEVVLGLPSATIGEVCAPGGIVILCGPDLKEELPVLFLRLRHAVQNDGVRVIELAPQRSGFSSLAAVSLFHRPGEAGEAVRALLDGIPAGKDGGGVERDALARAHDLLASATSAVKVIIGTQSVAESSAFAADAAAALLGGLPRVSFLPVLRRANVRGALDMGLAPGFLPGRVTLDAGRRWFEQHWPTTPAGGGLDATGILSAAANGNIDVLVLLGADPLADFPDRDLATRALAAVPTVVSLDLFLTESTRRADIVLPAAGYAETDGTTTNVEGRVSALTQNVTPPGSARTDWMVAAELAIRLGADLHLESTEQIWDEITRVAPAYLGLTLDRPDDPGHADGVLVTLRTSDGHGLPVAEPATEPAPEASADADGDVDGDPETSIVDPPELYRYRAAGPIEPAPHDAYGLRLIASRKLYDLGTQVQQSPSLAGLAPGTLLRVSPYDFARMGVNEGHAVRVRTTRGELSAEIAVDPSLPRGSAGMYLNQPGLAVSELIDITERVTHLRIDTGQP
jgi:NADH-quinone oxidoreductase subunit G